MINYIDPVIFWNIRWYAVFILIGIVIAVVMGIKEGKKLGIWSDFVSVSVQLPAEENVEEIVTLFIETLTNYELNEQDLYISPNGQLALDFSVHDSVIKITFIALNTEEDENAFPSEFIEEYLTYFGVTDSYPELAVEGATYETYGEKDESGVWSESISIVINLPEETDEDGVQTITDGLLELLDGFEYDEGENFYVSENRQIATNIFGDPDSKTITIDISAIPQEEEEQVEDVTYTLDDQSRFDITEASPDFYAWVWGGNYGDGMWVRVSVSEIDSVYTYELNVDSSAEGCVIVRVNPNNDIVWEEAGREIFDNTSVVWNQTDDIELPGDISTVTMIFNQRY